MGLTPLFDIRCPACEQPEPSGYLCQVCQSYLNNIGSCCTGCAEPLPVGERCGSCLKTPPVWDAINIPWVFDGLVRHLIHQYKYQLDRASGRALTQLWRPPVERDTPDALIAVPMHHAKQARHGFNHAQDLALQLSAKHNIPVVKNVRRQRPTRALEGLNKKERRRELAGCFELKQPPPLRVAIIDDVMTSGATTAELCRVLKRHGCQFVTVWALARTPL